MTQTSLTPELVGIWLIPGQPQTYEITSDGGYFIAAPEEPLRFEQEGTVMIWSGRRFERRLGQGDTPVGTWLELDTGDAWDFTADQGYTVLSPATDEAGQTYLGIWALRNRGLSLWACEKQADLTTDGAHLTFTTATGEVLRYGFTVEDGRLTLLDPEDWKELSRYISPERLKTEAKA